jgi:hypothetical protein
MSYTSVGTHYEEKNSDEEEDNSSDEEEDNSSDEEEKDIIDYFLNRHSSDDAIIEDRTVSSVFSVTCLNTFCLPYSVFFC